MITFEWNNNLNALHEVMRKIKEGKVSVVDFTQGIDFFILSLLNWISPDRRFVVVLVHPWDNKKKWDYEYPNITVEEIIIGEFSDD